MKRNNLKRFRLNQFITQQEMAEKLEISTPYYAMLESGKREGTLKLWQRLKAEFNLSNDELFSLIEKCD